METKSIVLLIAATVFAGSGTIPLAMAQSANAPASESAPKRAEAIFAGGCFWCVESDFEALPGVIEAISGYAGGHVEDPSYKQVTRGGTGHYEVAKIIYDPRRISYRQLVDFYWTSVDPTDAGGQFCDRGQSYQTAIFVTPEQAPIAKESKTALENSKVLKHKIVTPILTATNFYPAEDYHQDYYKKNKLRYKYYRNGCGRDKRLKDLWGKSPAH